jgi:phosphatidylserine/phosphatidylglycerophosphate/cardiolipin synthase-like enzyme
MRKVHVASASSLVGIAPIQIFFNDPARKINPITLENKLIVFMRSARESFDGAFYDISSEVVANELIALKKRGVVVRLVMESDTKSRSAIRKIISEGIQIVFDDSDGLMHNKFAIVDGVAVWTGSYNPVSHGEENDNNAVLVYSPDLASRFSEEFTDMFEHRLFGIARRGRPFDRLVALNAIDIAGTSVRAFFSPRHGIESIVAELVRNASSSVHFMAFSFTSDIIGEALLENRRRGVDVHGIVEERGALSTFSEYVKMIVEGMDVKIRRGRGVMHHKVIVIDGRIVITGSFNFSRGADSINDENIVIIESEEVARAYLNEFNRVRERSG